MAEKQVGKLEFSLMTSVKGASRRTPRKNHDGDGLLKWRDVSGLIGRAPVISMMQKLLRSQGGRRGTLSAICAGFGWFVGRGKYGVWSCRYPCSACATADV